MDEPEVAVGQVNNGSDGLGIKRWQAHSPGCPPLLLEQAGHLYGVEQSKFMNEPDS